MRVFIFNSYGEESFGEKLFKCTNVTPNTIINVYSVQNLLCDWAAKNLSIKEGVLCKVRLKL